jgi:hypothetical protein
LGEGGVGILPPFEGRLGLIPDITADEEVSTLLCDGLLRSVGWNRNKSPFRVLDSV